MSYGSLLLTTSTLSRSSLYLTTIKSTKQCFVHIKVKDRALLGSTLVIISVAGAATHESATPQNPAPAPALTPINSTHLGSSNMTPQQSSVAPQKTEQQAAPAGPAFTEQRGEAAAMALLCAEIDRMDAVAANTAAATEADKYVVIDGDLYVKAWLVSEEESSSKA
jgi:hypothetical protein